MNTKGLLEGNRVVIAQKPYIKGFSVISHTLKVSKFGSKWGIFRAF